MVILYNDTKELENEIRSLIMAFYHGEKIIVNPDTLSNDSPRFFLTVKAGGTKASVTLKQDDTIVEETAVVPEVQSKEKKDQIKILVYKVLMTFTGRTLPWGTQTGIRPTKNVMMLMEDGYSQLEIEDKLKKDYLMHPKKISLCCQVAKNEAQILKDVNYKKGFSLYVGIPFCPTICAYCSFSSYPIEAWKQWVEAYVDQLCNEIAYVADLVKSIGYSEGKPRPLTFYMGGGTPTALSAGQLDRLLKCLFKYFDLENVKEKTVEAGRPDSVTMDKLKTIYSYGISRISINPQTMNQKTLDLIGRKHTVEKVYDAFQMAREAGFNNINMDLIAGLPGETPEDFDETLRRIKEFNPESLTVHAMAIKRAALVNQARMFEQAASVEDVNTMINNGFSTAQAMDMSPYYMYRQKNIAGNLENVGYAKDGQASLYNILIMEEKQTIIGLGAGASTKVVLDHNRIERIENVKSVKDYVERLDDMISRKEAIKDYFK